MSDPPRDIPEDWARYRSYLRVLAGSGLNRPLQAKIDPSDIVQQTLLNAHRDLHAFRGSTEAEMLAWLRAILQNKIVEATRHFRRGKRDVKREQAVAAAVEGSSIRLEGLLVSGEPQPSDQMVREEKLLWLCSSLDSLPEDQRTAIDLHHLQNRTLSEVAEEMSRSITAVAGLLKRGLRKLRESIPNDL